MRLNFEAKNQFRNEKSKSLVVVIVVIIFGENFNFGLFSISKLIFHFRIDFQKNSKKINFERKKSILKGRRINFERKKSILKGKIKSFGSSNNSNSCIFYGKSKFRQKSILNKSKTNNFQFFYTKPLKKKHETNDFLISKFKRYSQNKPKPMNS